MEDDLRFDVAEGFARLGLQKEAMEALEEIPQSDKNREMWTLMLDLMVRTAKSWEAGEAIARKITPLDDIRQRRAAGRFWLSQAQCLCVDNEIFETRLALAEMFAVWPEGWPLAWACKELGEVW